MNWKWHYSVALFFLVSVFGAILVIGHISSPIDGKKDRDLASTTRVDPAEMRSVQLARHTQTANNLTELSKERVFDFDDYLENAPSIELSGRNYLVLPLLRAGFQELIDPQQVEHVHLANGLIFYQVNKDAPYIDDQQMPVIYDVNRKSLGVVTGKMMVRLKNEADLDQLKLSYSLEHYYFAKSINVHYFVIPKGEDPFEVFDEISNLSFVEKSQLEIIEDVPVIKAIFAE